MANLGTLLKDGAGDWLATHGLADSTDRFGALAWRLTGELGLTKDRRVVLVSAPGRTELAGNHTDHNRGRVLAASVNLDSIAVASPRDDMKVRLSSEGFPLVEIDLHDLELREGEKETTAALVRGVAAGLERDGRGIGGFDATASSTVLAGSGLSSSASIEILIGYIFDALYASEPAGPTRIAQISQFAENTYFGKPSGLMDQVACATGGAVAIDFADPEKPQIEQIAVRFAEAGLALLVVDTGANHADLTNDYAAIPIEMRSVAAELGAEVLGEATPAAFYEHLPAIRTAVGDRASSRALHFFQENERVGEMVAALRSNQMGDYIALMSESGKSSGLFLQNCAQASQQEEQGVIVALGLTEHYFRSVGLRSGRDSACRVHGGGFAGTIQVLLPAAHVDAYRSLMRQQLGENAVTELKVRNVGAIAIHDPHHS